jgi:hypothetical protein
MERSIHKAIESLCLCSKVKMLKVKWNLSHAIGVAMRRFNAWSLQLANPKWIHLFYTTLIELFTLSNNFKVRINACIALMTINLNDKNNLMRSSSDNVYIKLWSCLTENFVKLNLNEMALNKTDDETNEMQHKTTLIHQLCKLFTYLCKYLQLDDLECLNEKCLNGLKVTNATNGSLNQMRSHLISYIKEIFSQIETNKLEGKFFVSSSTLFNFESSYLIKI